MYDLNASLGSYHKLYTHICKLAAKKQHLQFFGPKPVESPLSTKKIDCNIEAGAS
jgi:hypothetical protein